ncbi:hypothetical protein P3L10_030520 [Capsicum annuum]
MVLSSLMQRFIVSLVRNVLLFKLSAKEVFLEERSKACTKASPYEGPFRADSPSWCWAPFEPEGILSSISAILSMVLGVHFGHVLIHMKDNSSKLLHWMVLNAAIPLNKQLYTVSYVCVTSGAAALVFPAFYILVDILNWKYLFLPLEWIGMNAMLVYVMAAAGIFAAFINDWYYEDPHNTLNDDHLHGYNDAEVKVWCLPYFLRTTFRL